MGLAKIDVCKKEKKRFFDSIKVLFNKIVTTDTKKIAILMVAIEDQCILDLKTLHQVTELNHRSGFLKRTTNGKQLQDKKMKSN